MNPIAAIRTLLLADTMLASRFGERVRTGYGAAVDVRPYCLCWQVSCRPVEGLAAEGGLDVATVQIDVYADTMAEANQLGRRVARVLSGFRRGKVAELWIASILRTGGPRQSAEQLGSGADQYLYRVGLDYQLFFLPTEESQ